MIIKVRTAAGLFFFIDRRIPHPVVEGGLASGRPPAYWERRILEKIGVRTLTFNLDIGE